MKKTRDYKHIHRMSCQTTACCVLLVFLVSRLLTPHPAMASSGKPIVISAVQEGLDPFKDELKAMEALKRDPVEANQKALAQIRFDHAVSLYRFFETAKDKDALELAALYADSAATLDQGKQAHWVLLGMLYLKLMESEYFLAGTMAIQAFEQAVSLQPKDPAARLLLGISLVNEEYWGEALDHFEMALKIKPKLINPPNIALMNICYISAPQTKRGIDFYEKILDGKSSLDYMRISRAILLRQCHNQYEAIEELSKVIKRTDATEADRNYAERLIESWKQWEERLSVEKES